jgi:antirestriction protein ArdC
MSPKQDAYQVVTDRIVEALEGGTIPWEKPWRSLRGELPTSLSTGRPYTGINTWLLSLTAFVEGYSSPFWGTYNQIKARGGHVRRGEQSTQIVLWKRVDRVVENEKGEKEESSYGFLRFFNVFNADQCDELELEQPTDELEELDPIEAAESIVVGYLQGPRIQHGGNRAFYSPTVDIVQMPQRGQFKSSEHYYGTLFHELVHSTGHEDRLKREMNGWSPDTLEDYSKEELVAEMGAAFLCGEAGIELEIEHSAGYIQHWLGRLRDDKKLLVSAAAQAQKASDHILGIS